MAQLQTARRIVILGAAGRDFHNFNVAFRNDPAQLVVAFTAAQIPGISGRMYPAVLAGEGYPDGIEIIGEETLGLFIREHEIDDVVFAYSDVPHREVMRLASVVLAAGADFRLQGPKATMLSADLPVIAVSAVRTGVGKSQTTRWLAQLVRQTGLRPVIIRHPMPYGNLRLQEVQRFEDLDDLDAAECTIEEREEYEPHIRAGNVVFAGVDYEKIIAQASLEAHILLWDGGNNDFPFVRPDLHIVLVDPLRPGHETTHHPGEAVLRMADIVVVAKCNSAAEADVRSVTEKVSAIVPDAQIVKAGSKVYLQDESAIREKSVIVIDDGPTLTHGGMAYGAGYIAAVRAGAKEIIDPRQSATGEIRDVFARFPHVGKVLPAMGYSQSEREDLAATINASGADLVVTGTPSDLESLLELNIPVVRALYDFEDISEPGLGALIKGFLVSSGLVDKGELVS
ncbi:MAG: cyclic 2,3-diphosphoglycerate synthase [Hyphomicrobiaceae bacterium]